MNEDWPAPQRSEHPPLPTTEDLPLSPDGYDRESVEDAFAAFYRHISQLDTTLRALEAIESFRLYAGELRADLRSIRAAGWTPYPRGYPSLPIGGGGLALPEALPRLVLEIAFLVVVAVVAAVGGFSTVAIIAVMVVAVTLAAGFEVLVSSSWRPVLTRLPAQVPVAAAVAPVAPAPIVLEAVPAAEGAGWAAFADAPAVEEATIIGSATEATDEDEDEPSLIRDLAPWERGFDGEKEDEAPVPR